jgi:myo-inositol-1(or 4)-monophosphatase
MSLPNSEELQLICTKARDFAQAAGQRLLGRFRSLSASDVEFKGVTDLVTVADREAQDVIVTSLAQAFPDHEVVAEESAEHGSPLRSDTSLVWYVDPLDGTTNFVHGVPIFGVSMGLYRGSEPLVAVVHAPALGETFHAVRGGGAFVNERRLHVSSVQELIGSLLCTGFACVRSGLTNNNLSNFNRLVLETQGVSRMGSASLDLAYVASGRLEAFWELNLSPWDVAAGALLVREAGGQVTGFGGEHDWLHGKAILATNGRIHKELASRLDPVLGPGERKAADPEDIRFLRSQVARFVAEREWEQFHNLKNLAMSISIEAAELMELFQWLDPAQAEKVRTDPKLRARVEEEAADVFCYLLSFSNRMEMELGGALIRKLELNRRKYPVETSRGRSGGLVP